MAGEHGITYRIHPVSRQDDRLITRSSLSPGGRQSADDHVDLLRPFIKIDAPDHTEVRPRLSL